VLFTAFCFISKVFITLSGVAGIPQGQQSRQNAEMWDCAIFFILVGVNAIAIGT
jgi:hypothetical protein